MLAHQGLMKLINQARTQTHQGLINWLSKEVNDQMLYISTTRTKLINQGREYKRWVEIQHIKD